MIMRLWHKDLLPYLPDRQLKGQLRELVAIMHDWRDKGKTNHLLINNVMEYPKSHLLSYFLLYKDVYEKRFGVMISQRICKEFLDFCGKERYYINTFEGWHSWTYLKICMCNLFEKYCFGNGKSAITGEEWERLMTGYKKITGQEYRL
jgi:uncharacterized protein (TIGR02328 family)